MGKDPARGAAGPRKTGTDWVAWWSGAGERSVVRATNRLALGPSRPRPSTVRSGRRAHRSGPVLVGETPAAPVSRSPHRPGSVETGGPRPPAEQRLARFQAPAYATSKAQPPGRPRPGGGPAGPAPRNPPSSRDSGRGALLELAPPPRPPCARAGVREHGALRLRPNSPASGVPGTARTALAPPLGPSLKDQHSPRPPHGYSGARSPSFLTPEEVMRSISTPIAVLALFALAVPPALGQGAAACSRRGSWSAASATAGSSWST